MHGFLDFLQYRWTDCGLVYAKTFDLFTHAHAHDVADYIVPTFIANKLKLSIYASST